MCHFQYHVLCHRSDFTFYRKSTDLPIDWIFLSERIRFVVLFGNFDLNHSNLMAK